MQCVVLAGGLGTRMRPWTDSVPKALLPVAGVPFVDHQLGLLASHDVTEVVFCIGYRGEMIRSFVGDGARWGLDVAYVDEGRDLRGTAGALRLALDGGHLADSFLVVYGDSYLPVAHRPVLDRLADGDGDGDGDAVMTVFRNRNAFDASNVLFRDGRVELYDKSGLDPRCADMEHIDYGLAALRRSLVESEVPPGERVDLADLYHRLSRDGRLVGHEVDSRFYEVGSPGGLAALEKQLMSSAAGRANAERRRAEPVPRI